jgi:tRNA U55 pseudouridine synthase TruB
LDKADAVLQSFAGEITQRPPPYSAVKHEGRPLYAYAREGTLIHGKPRQVHIHSIERLPLESPSEDGPQVLRFEVACSRGTYVRVLGVDIAKALGTVGHLRSLRRLASGPFKIEQSVDLPTLAEWACGSRDWATAFNRDRDVRLPRVPREEWIHRLEPSLQPPEGIFSSWPVKTCSENEAKRTMQGVCPAPPPGVELGDRYRVVHGETLLALAHVLPRGPRLLRVLQP